MKTLLKATLASALLSGFAAPSSLRGGRCDRRS